MGSNFETGKMTMPLCPGSRCVYPVALLFVNLVESVSATFSSANPFSFVISKAMCEKPETFLSKENADMGKAYL